MKKVSVKKIPKFSAKTIEFLKKAGREKRVNWLEKNQGDYDLLLREPLTHLATTVKEEISSLAPDYHYPQKGLGRLKRPANRVAERGGGLYKNWIHYSAARPRQSRFETNPNLFFLINTEDKDDPVLVAGGLYMPSSRQTKAIREAIARDASPFEKLFADKDFKRCFRGGFSLEKSATRPPRGFDPAHPKIDWLKLQAFFVWRPYSMKEFSSPKFAEIVVKDFKQILRLNRLLEKALVNRPVETSREVNRSKGLLDRLEGIERIERQMDF